MWAPLVSALGIAAALWMGVGSKPLSSSSLHACTPPSPCRPLCTPTTAAASLSMHSPLCQPHWASAPALPLFPTPMTGVWSHSGSWPLVKPSSSPPQAGGSPCSSLPNLSVPVVWGGRGHFWVHSHCHPHGCKYLKISWEWGLDASDLWPSPALFWCPGWHWVICCTPLRIRHRAGQVASAPHGQL